LLFYATAVLCGPRPCCCATPPPVPSVPQKSDSCCPMCASKKPTPTSPVKKSPCHCPHAEMKAATPPHTADDTRQTAALDDAGNAAVLPVLLVPYRSFTPATPPDPSPHFTRLCHRLRC
ncbi:MAG: hypothetical protein ACOVT5_16925, partial [Armatimonadaceae bacterium]